MPFPAWHRKRPSGVECCLSSAVVSHGVVIAFVTSVGALGAVNISESTMLVSQGKWGERNYLRYCIGDR